MIIQEGVEAVRWCSLFCNGNEATGDLRVETTPGMWIALPICDECKENIALRRGQSIDTSPGGVV